MIRVAFLDDHPAVRAGLAAIVAPEPDLQSVVPIPGGVGALDAGLAGALLPYGAPPAHVAAAVALWVPAVGGLLAYARLRPRLARTAPADRPALTAAGTSPHALEGALP